MRMEKYFESYKTVSAKHAEDLHEHLANVRLTDDYQSHEVRNFELPSTMYVTMFACYAVFFAVLLASLGRSAYAVSVISISICFAVMYFGLMTVLNRVNAVARSAIPDDSAKSGIETHTGWLSNGAVYAQILTVPVLFATFACIFAIIRVSA